MTTKRRRQYTATFKKRVALELGQLRHRDHRFEWTRAEFTAWAETAAARHGYRVEIGTIGPENPEVGGPTQRGLFQRCN